MLRQTTVFFIMICAQNTCSLLHDSSAALCQKGDSNNYMPHFSSVNNGVLSQLSMSIASALVQVRQSLQYHCTFATPLTMGHAATPTYDGYDICIKTCYNTVLVNQHLIWMMIPSHQLFLLDIHTAKPGYFWARFMVSL